MKYLCLLWILLLGNLQAAGPVVFRVSDPIQPGETALLFGDSIGAEVQAVGWRVPETGAAPQPQKLRVLQASDVSAKVLIPSEWKPGLFAIQLAGSSQTVYLNRPEAWWYLTGPRHKAAPGGTLRVFGKNLGIHASAWLSDGSRKIALPLQDGGPYASRFQVPASIAPGDYLLTVANGWGGAAGVSNTLPVTVAAPEHWPDDRFDVHSFGATGDGLHDDTEAIRAALAKAAASQGGIVYLPAGRYKISGKLVIPPHTVLRGEKRESVWLFVPRETPELETIFAGTHDFAIEELSLVSQTAVHFIVAPDLPAMMRKPRGSTPPKGQEASNVRLHRLRLQHMTFAHRINKGDPRRELAEGYSTVTLSGEDLELSDSEVISSGMPLAIHGGHRIRVERNRLDTGRQGWYGLWNTSETVMEENTIEGRDLEASYGGVQGRSDRFYFAGNRLQDGYGDEREALTFDSPYMPHFMGRAGNITAKTFTALDYEGKEKRWLPGELVGEACLIAYGKGLGQYIPIVGNTETTITLEHDWAVLPDASSHVVIRVGRSQIVVTRNHFTDASAAIQLYAQSYGIIVDGNRAERTGGSYGLAWDFWWETRKLRRYSTSMFNQWLNNDFSEGFIYQQGAWQNGVVGPAADPQNGKLEPPAIAVLGNVIRNNKLNGYFTAGALLSGKHPFDKREFGVIGYFGRDTMIEGNTVSDTPVALDIYPGYKDTLVRHNQVERSAVPFMDDGMNTWFDPAERLTMQRRAVTERFGKAPASEQSPWEFAAQSAKSPVESSVAAMLIGLHYERVRGKLRLRTEPWAPEAKVTGNGNSMSLRPNSVVEIGDVPVVEITVAGVPVRIAFD